MPGHPFFAVLSSYAAGDLTEANARAVERHLSQCARCRLTLGHLRELKRATEELRGSEHAPPAGVWAAILARRAEGDRGILPIAPLSEPVRGSETGSAEDADVRPLAAAWPRRGDASGSFERPPDPTRRFRRIAVVGAAALVLVAGLAGIVLTRGALEVEASWSEVRFSPARPVAGQEVEVSYRGRHFPDEDSLRLRASVRFGDNARPSRVTAAYLERVSEGVFRGRFRLPDSAVYVAFSIEDPEGRIVDDNGRRLWDLIVHSDEGRPILEALDQRRDDLLDRSWEEAHRTALLATEVYPEDPESWAQLRALEVWLLGDSVNGAAGRAHRERFQEFHAGFEGRQNLPRRLVSGMATYGIQAGADRSHVEHWRERLRLEFPNHPDALLARERELWARHGGESRTADAEGYFAALEGLWNALDSSAASGLDDLIENAIRHAVTESRPDMLLRWAERGREYHRGDPEALESLVPSMLGWHETRSTALGWVEEEIRWLRSDPRGLRPLSRTIAEQRAATEELMARRWFHLGSGRLLARDTVGAMTAFDRAAGISWMPEVFQALGELRLAEGDTTRGLRLLARAAADPAHESLLSALDSTWIVEKVDPAQWDLWLEEGRIEMSRIHLARSRGARVDLGARIRNPDGVVRSLEEVMGGRRGVLVYCGSLCGLAVGRLLDVRDISREVEDGALAIIPVTDARWQTGFELPRGWTGDPIPIYEDHRRQVRNALGAWSFPAYYLVDGNGWNAFGRTGLRPADLPSRIVALDYQRAVRKNGG